MANWWGIARITRSAPPFLVKEKHESLRSDRACAAQPAGIGAAEFADDGWHFGGRGLAGGDVVARDRLAAVGHATAGEVRIVRYGHCDVAPRPAKFRRRR